MKNEWAKLNVEASLELLSEQFSNPGIREHAVCHLDTIADDELVAYLLQLVQAMRSELKLAQRPLTAFLTRRAQASLVVGTRFMWYLKYGAWCVALICLIFDGRTESRLSLPATMACGTSR